MRTPHLLTLVFSLLSTLTKLQYTSSGVQGGSTCERAWYAYGDVYTSPSHIYGNKARTECETYGLYMKVKASLEGVKDKQAIAAVVAANSNVRHAPRLFAHGVPKTPSHLCRRIPGMEHNLDHVLKSIYSVVMAKMDKNQKGQHALRLAELGVPSSQGLWQQHTWRKIFGHWHNVFHGLAPNNVIIVVRLVATVIPIMFDVTVVPTREHLARISYSFFTARILLEYIQRQGGPVGYYKTNTLYWASIPYWVNQVADLQVPIIRQNLCVTHRNGNVPTP